jgi:dTDP-4-dehydrorhamnose reductase
MKILITGGSGLLGKSLLETKPSDVSLVLTWFKNIYGISLLDTWYKLDIRNKADIYELFHMVQPDAVIHCAAIGSVDYAEINYSQVAGVNVNGTSNIVDAANDFNAKVVYISTNAVFSGNLPPYNELSPLEPINAYGKIKLRAEQYVQAVAKSWLIIRPFLLYGWPYQGGRTNWGDTIIRRLRNGKDSFRMVHDCTWMPTYAPDCGKVIWKLLFQDDNQIFNVAGPERATLYEFALKVCEVFELEKNLIRPVGSDYFENLSNPLGTTACRPKDTTYDLIKLTKAGIQMLDIKTGLEKMRDEHEL